MRLAMWSGPRNLSTALMYAFGNRADFTVIDEPFYAAYLAKTGFNHPMREAILAAQPNDPAEVVESLLTWSQGGCPHVYQKLMTQHMVADIPRAWMGDVTNVFLIRHPARVVASFASKFAKPTLEDLGFMQQAALYDQLQILGQRALVVDAADIRADPAGMLRRLCAALDLPFDPAMLSWPLGGHENDGVWAAHWYGAVHRSTGFAGPEAPLPVLRGEAANLAAEGMAVYDRLTALKLG